MIGTLQAIVKPGNGSAIARIGKMQIGSVTIMIVFMSISNVVMVTVVVFVLFVMLLFLMFLVLFIVSVKIMYVLDRLKLTNKVVFKKVDFSHLCEVSSENILLAENSVD